MAGFLVGDLIGETMRANPPMSRDEEATVARRAKAGHKPSADRMILCNLGLVVALAAKYSRSGIANDDLLQYGVVGLLRALPKFEPERGLRFSTYARHWVLASLDDGAGVKEPLVRKSSDQARAMARGGAAAVPVISLDAPVFTDGAETYCDLLEGAAEPADEQLDRGRHDEAVLDRVARTGMDARERDVVVNRFMRDEPATLQELGDRHDCSRERIRQIEKKAKEKLRRVLADLAA